MEELAENHLTDNHSGKTNDNGPPAHIDVGKPLVLSQQRRGESHQTVGEHQAQNRGKIGVDPLSPGHIGIRAGGTQGGTQLCAEKPVEQGNDHNHKNGNCEDGILKAEAAHTLGADRAVGLSHDPQIDRVQRQLG